MQTRQTHARPLDFPALLNARDLGGHPTRDGGRTRERSLVRADDLARLTPAGVQALEAYGIETIIDLRWPEERTQFPSPVGGHPRLRHVPVSLLAASLPEWIARAGETCPKEQIKPSILTHARGEIRAVLQHIAAAPPGAILFHCIAGKDRTGLIAALLLTLADAMPEAIAYDYGLSSENLRESYLRERVPHRTPEQVLEDVRCPPEGVQAMLNYLDAAGGVRGYLRDIGLQPGEIEQLRSRLR